MGQSRKFKAYALILRKIASKVKSFCVYFFCCVRTYKPSLHDVGAYLALCWVPIRADGKRGEPLTSISSSPVSPGINL